MYNRPMQIISLESLRQQTPHTVGSNEVSESVVSDRDSRKRQIAVIHDDLLGFPSSVANAMANANWPTALAKFSSHKDKLQLAIKKKNSLMTSTGIEGQTHPIAESGGNRNRDTGSGIPHFILKKQLYFRDSNSAALNAMPSKTKQKLHVSSYQ